MSTLTKADFVAWLERLATVFEENREHLTELDSAIGDADHGTNMARGFAKVREKLPEAQEKPLGGLLREVGMTLVGTVGGASGPLYGTFFMKAGMAAKGDEDVNLEALAAIFEEGLKGIVQRGRAVLNDKTMVDALTPAVNVLKDAAKENADLHDALQRAAAAAKTGMEATTPMLAKKGRASYLGERSIGHQDPGATSSYLIMQAASDVWGAS